MAEFVTVSREYRRLCDAFEICKECPLNDLVKNTSNCETGVFRRYPEDAERVIMQWAAKHPIKTNGKKFCEVFGINLDSIEVVCRDGEGKVSHYQDVSAWLDKEYEGGQDEISKPDR